MQFKEAEKRAKVLGEERPERPFKEPIGASMHAHQCVYHIHTYMHACARVDRPVPLAPPLCLTCAAVRRGGLMRPDSQPPAPQARRFQAFRSNARMCVTVRSCPLTRVAKSS